MVSANGPRREYLHKPTDSNVEELPRPDHVENPLCIFKYCQHHLFLGRRWWSVFGMRTRMHNAVHVQVEVVKLLAIGVRFGDVNWNFLSLNVIWSLFNHLGDDLWVLLRKPAKQRWDTHICDIMRETVPSGPEYETTSVKFSSSGQDGRHVLLRSSPRT